MAKATLGPSDRARIVALEQATYDLQRIRSAESRSFRDLIDVFAIPIGHGDLLVYSRDAGGLVRVPVGPTRQVLIADAGVPLGVKWGWLSVGAPGFNRIELHDHGDTGFIHFYSDLGSETFHGNLYQDTFGSGGAAQSRVVLHTSRHNSGFSGIIELYSDSVDGTIPASVRINGAGVATSGHTHSIPVAANTVVSEFAWAQSSFSGNSGDYSRGDHTHGTPTPQGNAVVSEFAFGQSSIVGVSEFMSRRDHSHGTPVNPVLTNHPRFIAVDGINPNTQQVQMQAGNTVVTTNSTGGATIGYGAAFNNDTLSVTMTNGDFNTHPDAIFSLDIGGANASGFALRVRVGGANLVSSAVRICWTAIGY